jgi:TRAP-type C4-dicarboxylate transport system permease small subunit
MSEDPERDALGRLLAILHQLEDGFLALLLGSMIVLAPLQIFLRNFFDIGISWADPVLRILVLWVGLMGALAATRGDRQISIDVLSHLLGPRARAGVRIVTSVFASGISALVARASWNFVQVEIEYEAVAFAEVPAWIPEIVIPVSFGLIALRYLVYAWGNVLIVSGHRESLGGEAA